MLLGMEWEEPGSVDVNKMDGLTGHHLYEELCQMFSRSPARPPGQVARRPASDSLSCLPPSSKAVPPSSTNRPPQGYGIATYPSTPVTPKTLFYGASTSKAFTAAALSIMIASGNYSIPSSSPLQGHGTATLDWTTPIAALIPDDFVLMDDPWATAHITLEDALSHRTGLPRHDKSNAHWLDDGGKRRVATPRDVTRSLRYLP